MNLSNLCETDSTQTTSVETKAPSDSGLNLEVSATDNSICLSGMDFDVFIAARKGNVASLREHGESLQHKLTPTKNTVLHIYIACVGCSVTLAKSERVLKPTKIVEEIVQMCAPLLLQPNESGDTPLHFAARHGHADIVETVIEASKARGSSDLEKGVSTEENCWQALIRTSNKEKNTALHEAVRFNYLSVVKVLIKEDPEFFYRANDDGETPVYMAVERGYRELVIEMLDNCTNPAYQGPNGLTALHAAAISNDEQMTKKLLQTKGALTREANERGQTPLHSAVRWGHAAIVKQILEYDKSTAYICDKRKRAPFHYACYTGSIDLLNELVSRCPDCCEFVDEHGRNGLHYAIEGNNHQVENFIRKDPWLSSVLLNGKDAKGNTPLHEIATSLYRGVDFISDSRVDKMAFNQSNLNALDILKNSDTSLSEKIDLIKQLTKTGARRYCRLQNNENVPKTSMVEKIKEVHFIVSTIIATVTFAAGFTVPGGYQSEKGRDQGFAVLTRNVAFQAFVITNTIAMCMSSCAVMIRIVLALRRREEYGSFHAAINLTLYASIAMVVAFITGTYAVLGHSPELAIAACVIGCLLFFVFGFVMLSPTMRTCRTHFFKAHDRIFNGLYLYKMMGT